MPHTTDCRCHDVQFTIDADTLYHALHDPTGRKLLTLTQVEDGIVTDRYIHWTLHFDTTDCNQLFPIA